MFLFVSLVCKVQFHGSTDFNLTVIQFLFSEFSRYSWDGLDTLYSGRFHDRSSRRPSLSIFSDHILRSTCSLLTYINFFTIITITIRTAGHRAAIKTLFILFLSLFLEINGLLSDLSAHQVDLVHVDLDGCLLGYEVFDEFLQWFLIVV